MSSSRRTVDEDSRQLRLRMLAFVGLTLFGAMFARLWYLQALESEALQAEAISNVLQPIYEQAPRGRILDRDGRVVVDNRVVQVVTLDRQEVQDALSASERSDMFLRLAEAISRSGRLTKKSAIERSYNDPQYGPFDEIPVAVGVDPSLLVFLGERPEEFPGVRVVQRTIRTYPYGNLAAHLLGYVGPVTGSELEAENARIDPSAVEAKTYQANDEIGKTGVEKAFEEDLRGVPGVRWLELDSRRRVVRERSSSPPIPGNDLWLTIDIDLQAFTEEQLADELGRARRQTPRDGELPFVAAAGAAVALDPRNGDVLAMASYPTYDPSEFVNGISRRLFKEVTSKENHVPVLNRAIQGAYPPGSTFKLVTAYAALSQGVIGPDGLIGVRGLYTDTGTYKYPDCLEESSTCVFESPFRGSRQVDLREALTVSSDPYFYRIGGEGFWPLPRGEDEGIQLAARQLGLGSDTGVQLPYERSGVVPDRAYFDALFADGAAIRDGSQWYAGDTINLSIGQGDMLVTPIQLANAYATIANGGRLHQPNIASKIESPDGVILREFGPRVLRDLEIPDSVRQPIIDGLLGVPLRGTARKAFNDPVFGVSFPLVDWPVAGKTGTAEKNDKADTALFVAFGPNDFPALGVNVGYEPSIVLAAVFEESGFGGSVAAPMVARTLDAVATDSLPRVRTKDELDRYYADLVKARLAAATAADEAAGTTS